MDLSGLNDHAVFLSLEDRALLIAWHYADYSPRMPMKNRRTEAEKNRAIRIGAVLAAKRYQNRSLAIK